MTCTFRWTLCGLLGLTWAAGSADAQGPKSQDRLVRTAGILSEHAQHFRDMLEQAPNGAALFINARRLGESAEHLRNAAEASGPDLARDYARVRMDFDYLSGDFQTVYGPRRPPQLQREWQHLSQAFQELSRTMGGRSYEPTTEHPAFRVEPPVYKSPRPRYTEPRY